MKAVLALVVRADNGSSPRQRQDVLDRAISSAMVQISSAFPARAEPEAVDIWRDDCSGTVLISWHNEPKEWHINSSRHSEHGAVEAVGYLDTDHDPALALDAPVLLDYAVERGGCYGLLRARSGVVEAVTDATRSNAVYWAESPLVRVLGTRALLVHLVNEHSKSGFSEALPTPVFDLLAMRNMPLGGYLLGDGTPYRGVTALGIAEQIRIDPWYTRFERRTPEAYGDIAYGGSEWLTLVEQTAQALVATFDPIPGPDLHVALTGGRDSRILIAGLVHRNDINVTTSTMGMPDDPDVFLAAKIAQAVGVPHHSRPPGGVSSKGTIEAEDPVERITRILDVYDGMISAWDDIEDYGPVEPTPTLSGVGGEIIRGGLILPRLDTLTPEVALKSMQGTLIGGGFFTQPYVESAKSFGAPLMEICAVDPHRAIDDFYYFHRNGRWVSSRRSGARFRRRTFDPLVDNRFIRLVRQIPPASRWNERLAFDLIAYLAPQLRDLPIEGYRWRFERHEPATGPDGNQLSGWADRVPLVRTAETASYTWKTLKDPVMYRRMSDLILDGLRGDLLQMLDRGAVRKYIEGRARQFPAVVWHLATLAVMVNTAWYHTTRPIKREHIPVNPEPDIA